MSNLHCPYNIIGSFGLTTRISAEEESADCSSVNYLLFWISFEWVSLLLSA